MVTHVTATYAHGPTVVQFLIDEGKVERKQDGSLRLLNEELRSNKSESVRNRLKDWDRGGWAEFYALDRVLQKLDRMPLDLTLYAPDCWRDFKRPPERVAA